MSAGGISEATLEELKSEFIRILELGIETTTNRLIEAIKKKGLVKKTEERIAAPNQPKTDVLSPQAQRDLVAEADVITKYYEKLFKQHI